MVPVLTRCSHVVLQPRPVIIKNNATGFNVCPWTGYIIGRCIWCVAPQKVQCTLRCIITFKLFFLCIILKNTFQVHVFIPYLHISYSPTDMKMQVNNDKCCFTSQIRYSRWRTASNYCFPFVLICTRNSLVSPELVLNWTPIYSCDEYIGASSICQ